MKRVALVGLLAAVGCAHYAPTPLSVSETLRTFEDRRLDAAAVAEALVRDRLAPEWPPPAWDLDALTLVAFHYHPDLAVARTEWSVSRAAVGQAGERPNPDVGTAAGLAAASAGVAPWLLALDLILPVETAGKRAIRIAQATAAAEAARFAIAVRAWQVRARLRRSLLAVYAGLQEQAHLVRQLDLETQLFALLERQRESGAISSLEVSRGRAALGHTRLQLQDADRRLAETRVHLAAAIGVVPEALVSVTLSFEAFEQTPPRPDSDAVHRLAIVSRPDVLGALADYDAAERALQLEVAKQYPDLRFGPAYELDQGEHKWRLLSTVSVPVRNRNRGAIAEADARRSAAAARFLAIQAAAIEQIDTAVASVGGALDRLAAADDLLRQQRAIEQTAAARFDAGAISRLDLLAVRLETLAIERTVLEARLAAHDAAGRLESAMQSPLALERWLRTDADVPAASATRRFR